MRRASCDLQHAAGFGVTDAGARLGWLSLGSWQKTQACCSRALCRACYDRLTCYRRTLHRRMASLLRCKTVVRRASCLSNAQPAFAWHARKRHCGGCPSEGGETRELDARAPCGAGCERFTHYERALHRRQASLLRCNTVVRRVSYDLQHAAGIAWHANKRHCAGYLSGGGKTRKLAACARCAALTVIGLHAIEGHCTDAGPLFFGARRWCDVRAVISNTQPVLA